MNLYFFGGTFDPPHLGHLKIAKYCLSFCDRFLFIPTKKSPHKKIMPIATTTQRKNMLKLLIEDVPKAEIIDYEIKNDSPSYTWLTIQFLKTKFNPKKITMVIGADQLSRLDSWKDINKIYQNVEILCFNRGKIYPQTFFEENRSIRFITDFKIQISSSDIRAKIQREDWFHLEELISKSILNFIINNNIYQIN